MTPPRLAIVEDLEPWEQDPGGPPTAGDDASDAPDSSAVESMLVRVTPEWMTTPPSARRWLLQDRRTQQGALPLGKCGQLIAEGGVGKTMALLQLALAVATGGDWLGTFTVATPGRVLLLLGEEDAEEVQRRVYAASRHIDPARVPTDSIVVLPLAGYPCAMLESDERGNLIAAPFFAWLLEFVERTGPWSLVAIDPLSRFAGADAEKDNAAGTRFVQACEALSTTGATVLVAHHTDKTSRREGRVTGASARGSTSLHDGFRWQAALSAQKVDRETVGDWFGGEVVTLSFTKSNYSIKGDDLLLRREDGGPLVPLDSVEREALARARSGDDERAARTAGREADREKTVAQRQAREAETRKAKEAERARARLDEQRGQDDALRGLLRAEPGSSYRMLRAKLGWRDAKLDAAIARAGTAIRIENGARGATLHFLTENDLPTQSEGS